MSLNILISCLPLNCKLSLNLTSLNQDSLYICYMLVDVTIPDPWTNLIFRFFKIVWSRYPGECFMFYIDWSCMYILSTTFIIHQIRFLLKWICIWLPDNQIILRHWKWRCRTSSKNRYRMMKCSQMGLFKQFWHSVIQRFYYHSDATKCPSVGHFM